MLHLLWLLSPLTKNIQFFLFSFPDILVKITAIQRNSSTKIWTHVKYKIKIWVCRCQTSQHQQQQREKEEKKRLTLDLLRNSNNNNSYNNNTFNNNSYNNNSNNNNNISANNNNSNNNNSNNSNNSNNNSYKNSKWNFELVCLLHWQPCFLFAQFAADKTFPENEFRSQTRIDFQAQELSFW